MAASPETVTVEFAGRPFTFRLVYAPSVPDDWPDAYVCTFGDDETPPPDPKV